jgi:ribosomal protein S12 methylthiotransferase accessory factor
LLAPTGQHLHKRHGGEYTTLDGAGDILDLAMVRYQSSLRARDADETYARALPLAPGLGISRVTEITQLDRIGLPVFVAIRPDALPGTLCVSAGKGLTRAEARIGALMESLELAWTEHRRSTIAVERIRADSLSAERPDALLEFCPRLDQYLDLRAAIDCVRLSTLDGCDTRLVPLELVLHPLAPSSGGARWFGTGSNGLASGNDVDEATTHALAELIERDTTSFHHVRDAARLVRAESLPEPVTSIRERLDTLGFDLIVRHLPNEFALPCFTALIVDRAQPDLTLRGDGCHPWKEIALLRAVTESAQCRLSLIHGGRDDLRQVFKHQTRLAPEERARVYETVMARLRHGGDAVDYAELGDESERARDHLAAQELLVERLRGRGFALVLRHVYTPRDYPVAVVRVIVPGLEHYAPEARRVGPRLRSFMRATASASLAARPSRSA